MEQFDLLDTLYMSLGSFDLDVSQADICRNSVDLNFLETNLLDIVYSQLVLNQNLSQRSLYCTNRLDIVYMHRHCGLPRYSIDLVHILSRRNRDLCLLYCYICRLRN